MLTLRLILGCPLPFDRALLMEPKDGLLVRLYDPDIAARLLDLSPVPGA